MNKVRFLTRKEASRYLLDTWGIRRTPKTLAKLATTGGGCAFRKDGIRVLYDPADLDEWAESILSPRVDCRQRWKVIELHWSGRASMPEARISSERSWLARISFCITASSIRIMPLNWP